MLVVMQKWMYGRNGGNSPPDVSGSATQHCITSKQYVRLKAFSRKSGKQKNIHFKSYGCLNPHTFHLRLLFNKVQTRFRKSCRVISFSFSISDAEKTILRFSALCLQMCLSVPRFGSNYKDSTDCSSRVASRILLEVAKF